MEFKIGDRVVVINASKDIQAVFINKVGTISNVDADWAFPYSVRFEDSAIEAKNQSSGRWLWRDNELRLEEESQTLDFLVKKISEIIDFSTLKVEFYSDSIAIELFELPVVIEYVRNGNVLYFNTELSDGKIDPESFMMIAKVLELLNANKDLLKEFCKS